MAAKKKDNPKDCLVTIRMSKEDREALRLLARAENRTLSRLVRGLVKKEEGAR